MAARSEVRRRRLARLLRPRRLRHAGAPPGGARRATPRHEGCVSLRRDRARSRYASRGPRARAARAGARREAASGFRGGGVTVRIFVIANQKGGVGKTSIAVNLSASLAHYGRRALLIDLDPQGNATTGSGVDKSKCEKTVYGVLLGEHPMRDAIRPCEGNYDIVASNRELAGAEGELIAIERREYRLRDALAPAAKDYDFVVIDCPPALNMLTVNGFTAADAVIIPMQCA